MTSFPDSTRTTFEALPHLTEVSRLVAEYRTYLQQESATAEDPTFPEEIVIELHEYMDGLQTALSTERFFALARTPKGHVLTVSNPFPVAEDALSALGRTLRAFVDPQRFAEAIG